MGYSDSNAIYLIQSERCCHYTISQYSSLFPEGGKCFQIPIVSSRQHEAPFTRWVYVRKKPDVLSALARIFFGLQSNPPSVRLTSISGKGRGNCDSGGSRTLTGITAQGILNEVSGSNRTVFLIISFSGENPVKVPCVYHSTTEPSCLTLQIYKKGSTKAIEMFPFAK